MSDFFVTCYECGKKWFASKPLPEPFICNQCVHTTKLEKEAKQNPLPKYKKIKKIKPKKQLPLHLFESKLKKIFRESEKKSKKSLEKILTEQAKELIREK